MLTDIRQTHEYCGRESALIWRDNVEPESRYIPVSERLTYDVGNFLQERVTKALHPEAFGDWECPWCDSHWRGDYHLCTRCGHEPRYVEMHFRSPKSGVIGSIDLALRIPPANGKAVICEIKTIEKDAFGKLAMAMIEHRQRACGYLKLLNECVEDQPWIEQALVLDWALILYICKGFGHYVKGKGNGGVNETYTPFQEFVIHYEGGAAEHVDEVYDRATAYWNWRANFATNLDAPLPPRCPSCTHKSAKRAGHCTVADACWKGDKVG